MKKEEYNIEPDGEQDFVISDVSPEEAKELDEKTQHAADMAWVLSADEDPEDISDWDENGDEIPMTKEKWESLSFEEKLEYQGEKDGPFPFNYSDYDEDTKEYHVFITWVR